VGDLKGRGSICITKFRSEAWSPRAPLVSSEVNLRAFLSRAGYVFLLFTTRPGEMVGHDRTPFPLLGAVFLFNSYLFGPVFGFLYPPGLARLFPPRLLEV